MGSDGWTLIEKKKSLKQRSLRRAAGSLVPPEQLPSSEFLVKLLTRGSVSWESTKAASNRNDSYFEFPLVLTQRDVAKVLRTGTIVQCRPILGAPFSFTHRDAAENQNFPNIRIFGLAEPVFNQYLTSGPSRALSSFRCLFEW